MEKDNIVIVGAARTPVGKYLGDLKTVPVQELGRIALEGALERAKVSKEDIDELIVGHVTQTQHANNTARVIAMDAGLPYSSTAYTVNRICGSGFQSAVNAYQTLVMGDADFVAAGGVESLSRAEYYMPIETRWEGFKIGNFQVTDSSNIGHESGAGAPGITHMGDTAENVVERFNITREEQDQFAYDSQMKAKRAIESGRMGEEIVPVEVTDRRGNVTIVDKDGHPRPDTSLEKLTKLKPAFKALEEGGSVTAGNASGMNDGGAFEIFTKESIAQERDLEIMARLVDYAITGVDPRVMGLGPVSAINKVLEKQNLTMDDIDILEINEAFAGQVLGCLHELDIAMDSAAYEKLNPNGGAVALGHPLGMSGARILTSIMYEFKNNPDKRYAIGSACIGGGQGIAILLENGYYEK